MRICFTCSVAEEFASVIANVIRTKGNLPPRVDYELDEFICRVLHEIELPLEVVLRSHAWIDKIMENLDLSLRKEPRLVFISVLFESKIVLFYLCSRDPSVF
jgi:hypothetical protein